MVIYPKYAWFYEIKQPSISHIHISLVANLFAFRITSCHDIKMIEIAANQFKIVKIAKYHDYATSE